jgi:hypothetical protein
MRLWDEAGVGEDRERIQIRLKNLRIERLDGNERCKKRG